MGTHNICQYKEVGKKYTGCNLKTAELRDCALIEVCAVIRSNTVLSYFFMKAYIVGTHLKCLTSQRIPTRCVGGPIENVPYLTFRITALSLGITNILLNIIKYVSTYP